jgi:hypothetical protein
MRDKEWGRNRGAVSGFDGRGGIRGSNRKNDEGLARTALNIDILPA